MKDINRYIKVVTSHCKSYHYPFPSIHQTILHSESGSNLAPTVISLRPQISNQASSSACTVWFCWKYKEICYVLEKIGVICIHWAYVRYEQLLRIVYDLFSDHDDGELLCKLDQTSSVLTLKSKWWLLLDYCDIHTKFHNCVPVHFLDRKMSCNFQGNQRI